SQRQYHRQIKAADGSLEMPFQKKIEKSSPTQNAQGNFSGKPSVGRFYVRGQCRIQQIACVRALCFHPTQHVKRDFSGWGNTHGEALRAEALTQFNARSAHELKVRDAVAALHLDVLDSQD